MAPLSQFVDSRNSNHQPRKHWRVECTLSSPIAGEIPMLDALLEFEMAQRHGLANRMTRDMPCLPAGAIHIPCLRGSIGGVQSIPRCSSPIVSYSEVRQEHFAKRLAVEHAGLLSESSRGVVAMGNSTYKSYRLPLKLTHAAKVVWFVSGAKRRNLLSLLDSVKSIGKKRSCGYGRVVDWEAYEIEKDLSWFAEVDGGDGVSGASILMRPLPYCRELPVNLVGFRRAFAGVVAPYWHPDRQMEVVVPV